MTQVDTFSGVIPPVMTPFTADLAPDKERFVAHCQWLLDQGATGLAPFGTTGEANSLSVDERLALLDAVVEAGIRPKLLMPGTGCCALSDSVRMTGRAVAAGCGGVLLLPPFFYKGLSDDAVFRSIAEVIDRVGDDRLRVYLYHIPPVAQVGFSLEIVGRLIEAYPGIVVGLKDSSGDWSNTEALLKAFPGFATFSGSEVFLLANLRGGGVGSITATGNVNLAAIRALFDRWQDADADALQADITALRETIQAYPMIPALKAVIASYRADPAWAAVRPPLLDLDPRQADSLLNALRARAFPLAA
ncbi:MAG: dihydrodipicolinate synthase family protein [Alphaproteobacteria bacterium]|jgi:4-hydroxy-tetrahydrodipicolinate synthase